jgi:sulfite reductase (NADPH) flavoprotein alpha-component
MADTTLHLSSDAGDWALALGMIALWLALTVLLVMQHARKAGETARALVVHASQTGHAGDLAQQAQLRIAASGTPCALIEADNLTSDLLAAAELLLFVASTTGEGEAPDNARRFERDLLSRPADLSGKHVAVLALGDHRYVQFCGFGRRVDEWARRCGGEMLFPSVEVDDLAPTDLAAWDRRLADAGYPADAAPVGEVAARWHVTEREQVAGPSRDRQGGLTSDGLYRIALRPAEGAMPAWEIGDLFELSTPDGHLRDYSIASLPGDEAIHLFVRRVVGGGVTGIGSGHLTDAEPDSAHIMGRVRSHRSFRPPTGQGPLLAIGAGSGWAGLRPHLLHAMALGAPCHLVFGERAAEADSPILAEMRDWQSEGRLGRLDVILSPPGGGGPYVQHHLARSANDLAEFLGAAGRIVICGQLAMGEQSLAALAEVLGEGWLVTAREEGRLLRDLY